MDDLVGLRQRIAELEKSEKRLRQAEEALRELETRYQESEAHYRNLVESSGDIIFAIASDGTITSLNLSFETITGWSRAEWLGKNFQPLIHPGDLPFQVRIYQHIFNEEMPRPEFEIRILSKPGDYIPLEFTVTPQIRSGKVIGYLGIARSTQELNRERIFNMSIIQASPVFFVAIDASGKTLMMNNAMLNALGYTIDEVTGKDYLLNFVPEADREMVSKIFEELISSNKPSLNENRVLTRDKRELLVEWHRRPVFKKDGSFDYSFGFGIDITERRRSEEKIREQAALIDNAHDAIAVLDLENYITYWNKSAAYLYGWAADEAIGKNINELLYKKDSIQFVEARKSVIEAGEWTGKLHQVTKEGKELIVESRWILVRDNKGDPKSILIINIDITEMKRLEELFLRAQRMESIGMLTGGIAHDLNNILTPLILSLQVLRERFTDEESQRLLNILERSAQRGTDIVKHILSFVHGAQGEHRTVQVVYLISEVEKIVKETFPKSIKIRTVIPEDLRAISGDVTQLHQVLMNLCVNARDAMQDGGILCISAKNTLIDENHARAKAGPYIVISVSDTGTGIPPEIIGKIFEPFFTTKNQGKGTGLGLSTALWIVKGHGGFIDVHSEVGKGATFKVYLPATETEARIEQEQKSRPEGGNGNLVLVVDDEAPVREITRKTLEANGYRVLTASDGAEAIVLYAQNREDIRVVLMDMAMPVMEGSASIWALRKIDPSVRVIAVSGLIEKDIFANIVHAVDAFLPKPYNAEQLLNTIDKIINR